MSSTVVEPEHLLSVTFVGENLQSQLGYKAEQVLGNANFWPDHVHPEDRDLLMNKSEILEKGQASYEYRLLSPDGSYRWIQDQARLVKDARGRPVELIGSWLDVTDRKRMEERLGHSSKMEAVGVLAGGIAHDFNNLLTAIGGYAELVQAGLPEDDPTVQTDAGDPAGRRPSGGSHRAVARFFAQAGAQAAESSTSTES